MIKNINAMWKKVLAEEFKKPYFQELTTFIDSEYSSTTVYPPQNQLFSAFTHTPFEQVQVVILGQDPYHGDRQAHGLSFSVPEEIRIPPSLKNIYTEIQTEFDTPLPTSGNLERWTSQGVFLLNSILTVRANQAASHRKKGWETFTDSVIQTISEQKEHVVFLLWGAYAQKKSVFIDESKHCVLKSAHPSPLSAYRGFFGNNHFKQVNKYLRKHKKKEILW